MCLEWHRPCIQPRTVRIHLQSYDPDSSKKANEILCRERKPLRNEELSLYRADSGVRITLVRVTIAVARLAQSEIYTLDGAGVSGVAVFARKSFVTARTRAMFNSQSASLPCISFFRNIHGHFGKPRKKRKGQVNIQDSYVDMR